MANETSPEPPDHPQAPPGPRRPSSLPAPLTSLIGRDTAVRDVAALLDDPDTRLLTITGPGGVGKTRLALALAAKVEPDYADGVAYLPLAPVGDPDLVLPAIAQSLGVQERGDRPIVELVIAHLRDRHLLLVLDNFEHLLVTPPLWLNRVLTWCPRLAVLVTSRIALGLTGEQRYVAPPLALPASDIDPAFDEVPSVALFVRRARAVRPDFAVTGSDRASVATICRRLDGLPLAIELAAARVSVLSPDQMLSRLTGGLRLLTDGPLDAAPRQQSMFDAIGWSYDLLTADEQRVFQHLSVFVGGFTLGAAEAIDASPRTDTVSVVSALVDSSLLRLVDEGAGPPRFLMLETIREFGLEQLAARGDEQAVRGRHADWCLDLTSDATPFDPTGQRSWLESLQAEEGNLRAAATWLGASGRERDFAELVTRLRWFWYLTGRESEGLQAYQRVLAGTTVDEPTVRADVLLFAGHLAEKLGRPEAAALLEDALAVAQASGDALRLAEGRLYTAMMQEERGDYDDAEEGLRIARTLYETMANSWRIVVVDYHLGLVTYGKGDLARAEAMLEAASSAAEAIGDEFVPALSRSFLALIACERHDVQRASAHLSHTLAESTVVLRHDRSIFLCTAGVYATTTANHESAARLFGAAARGDAPMLLPERVAFERAANRSRRHLGHDAWTAAWQVGWHLRNDEVRAEIASLLAGAVGTLAPVLPPARRFMELTRRELEVLRLMADGLTNQQIADTVFVSRNTVASHVAHILAKLGVESRTAAVSVAIRERLV